MKLAKVGENIQPFAELILEMDENGAELRGLLKGQFIHIIDQYRDIPEFENIKNLLSDRNIDFERRY